jgi:hypothetical protein
VTVPSAWDERSDEWRFLCGRRMTRESPKNFNFGIIWTLTPSVLPDTTPNVICATRR